MNAENQSIFSDNEDDMDSDSKKSLPTLLNIQIMKSSDSDISTDNENSYKQPYRKQTPNINSSNLGTFTSEQKLDKIFQRITSQLDFLNKTANMITSRMNALQKDIDFLNQENNIQ